MRLHWTVSSGKEVWVQNTGEENHIHEGKEEAHGYTDSLIKRAVTQELRANGGLMDWTMSRWQMSDADLDELIEYLKTLE